MIFCSPEKRLLYTEENLHSLAKKCGTKKLKKKINPPFPHIISIISFDFTHKCFARECKSFASKCKSIEIEFSSHLIFSTPDHQLAKESRSFVSYEGKIIKYERYYKLRLNLQGFNHKSLPPSTNNFQYVKLDEVSKNSNNNDFNGTSTISHTILKLTLAGLTLIKRHTENHTDFDRSV